MIDTKRLATDAAYWDECGAPEDATHAIPKRGYNATGVVWFKRVSGDDWKVWSRYDTGSFLRWCDSAGTSDGPHFIPRPQAPVADWVDGLPPETIAEFRKALAINLQNSIEAITGELFSDDDSLILAHEMMAKYDLSEKLKFSGD